MENHSHNGQDADKIKSYNVIPTLEMTSAQLTTYLSRKAINGEEFNVYVTDTLQSKKYVMINNAWVEVGGGTDVYLGATVSDNLKISSDTERTVNGNVGGICKSIQLYRAGNVRIKWDSHIRSGFSGQSAYLLKNGTTIQSAASNTNTAYETYTFDTNVSFGDVFALSGENNGSSNYIRYFRNFRIYYDIATVTDQSLIDTNK
jgi:hypothetical protein